MNWKEHKIGIVGLGRMGANMARRLSSQGVRLSALYDINPEVTNLLATELNTTAAACLSQITALSEIILSVVPDDGAMREIFTRSADNLLVGAAGRIFINFATLSPQIHHEIEQAANAVGASSIEACMASSITQAREGSLLLICGGDAQIVQQMTPVFEVLSTKRYYVGPTGSASQVKALVNMVMNINTAGLAEGLGLGSALGLDLGVLREIFANTGANSRVLETDGADMVNREHDCYFSAAHAAKDSGIAQSLAIQVGLKLPLAEAALAQYQRMVECGLGDLDKSGVAELTFLERLPPRE